jgi:hypothetical protein
MGAKERSATVDDGRTMYDLDLAEETETETRSPEEQRILSWRYEQLLGLGLTVAGAQLLAESGADLGLVRRLVAAGCAPDLAARIAL